MTLKRTTYPTKVPSLPKLPSDISPELRRYLENLVEGVEVRLGRRGDQRDRAITLRELINSGLALDLLNRPFDPNLSGSDFTPSIDTSVDTTVPPAPTGFAAAGAYSVVILSWDRPNYRNHSQTEIWRHDADVIGDAQLVGTASGTIFSDPVGESSAYYYWIRFISEAGIPGPYNSTSGTFAETAPDVEYLLELLTGSITESQLYNDLNTRIDLIEALENFTGYVDTYTGDSLRARLNTNDTNIASLNNSIASINTNISNIQSSINDLVAGTTSVYVQATAPVDNPPGTIAEFSRWYDSDDNNKVYVWIDQGSGLEWVSLEDPRIGANEAAVIALNAEVFNGDGSSRLATAAALSVLDATVTNLNGTVTSLSTDITDLNNEVFNPDGSSRLATSSALSALSSTVQTQGNIITSVQSDVTTLESEVFNPDGTSRLATANALASLTNTVTAQGTNIVALQSDVVQLQADVLNAENTLAAQGSALSSLTNTVTTQGTTIGSIQTDIIALEGSVSNLESGVSANGSAISTLNNTVVSQGQDIGSLQSSVISLSAGLTTANTNISANGTAISNLSNTVTAQGSAITVAQGDITALESTVNNPTTGVAATSTAVNDLTTRVTSAEGTISSNSSAISVLNNTINDPTTGLGATSSAVNALDSRVTSAEGTISSQGTLIVGLQNQITSNDGEISANANNITTVTNRVTVTEGNINALSSQVNTLSTTVGANTAAVQVNAQSIDGLEGQYTVKIDNNGYVSGFGLASTPVNGTPFSEFIVRADRFAVGSGNVDAIPFVVTTSTTILNGETVPPGVYIDQAYIKNGAITNAKIGTLSADKITTGFIRSEIIEAGTITADKIDSKAITAEKLAISSSTDGTASSIYMDSNGAIKVYDASGTLRVKLGNLNA